MEAKLSQITLIIPSTKRFKYSPILHSERDRIKAYITQVGVETIQGYHVVNFILSVTSKNMEAVRNYAKSFMYSIRNQIPEAMCYMDTYGACYKLPTRGKTLVPTATIEEHINSLKQPITQ